MKGKVERTSFAAGEVSSRLGNRRDLARQGIAVALADNFCVLLEGGMTRRSGTRIVDTLANQAQVGKMVPFYYAEGDSYDLIFNNGKIRFVQGNGYVLSAGVPYEINSPYAAADLVNLRWTQAGNLLFLTCRGYETRVLTRTSHTSWSLALYTPKRGPVTTMNINSMRTVQAGATIGATTLTADSARFTADDVGTVIRIDEEDYSSVPTWSANEAVVGGTQRRWLGRIYWAVASTGDCGPNPPTHSEGIVNSGGPDPVAWRYEHSGYGFVEVLSLVGAAPATQVNVTVTGKLPASVVAGATSRWWPGAWSNARGWPETVSLHENRLLFTRGDQYWFTVTGDFFDFDATGDPDSSFFNRVTSPDGDLVEIRWALSRGTVVMGVASSEWTLRGNTAAEALTFENTRAVPEDSNGSCAHVPIVADTGAVFIGRSRRRLHFAQFDHEREAVDVAEITLTARHILKGLATGLAYQKDPGRIVWICDAAGRLFSVTFMPKQEVIGWSRHTLVNGIVEDIVSVPGTNPASNEVYFIVRRTINGGTKRYIERLMPFFEAANEAAPTAAGAWLVDCGLSYSGAPVTSLSGLGHLEGQTVRVFADGAERPMAVVTAGAIALAQPASEIVVGLPIVGRVRSLPFELQSAAGSTRGKLKQASSVIVDVDEAAGGKLVSNFGRPEPIDVTGAVNYGQPLPLRSGAIPVTVESPTSTEAILELICDNALPFTLTGWAPDIDVTED